SSRRRRGPWRSSSWRAVATASWPRRPEPRKIASSSASERTPAPRASSFSRGRSWPGQSRMRIDRFLVPEALAAGRGAPPDRGKSVGARPAGPPAWDDCNRSGAARAAGGPAAIGYAVGRIRSRTFLTMPARRGLRGQRLLLCVCGGIAAYKAPGLLRRLGGGGAQVQVAMTDSAQRFVGAQTFQALSGHPVRTSLWDAAAEAAMGH